MNSAASTRPAAGAPGDRLAVGGQRFVDDAKVSPRRSSRWKSIVGREHLGHLRGHAVGDARFVGGGEQRGADRAAAEPHRGRAAARPRASSASGRRRRAQTLSRLKWVAACSSAAKRATSSLSRPSAPARTCTILPARPSSSRRASLSLRMKAAASGSATPRRRSRLSAVSPTRVRSLRDSCRSCSASASSCAARSGSATDFFDQSLRQAAASGASGAMPNAVMPEHGQRRRRTRR